MARRRQLVPPQQRAATTTPAPVRRTPAPLVVGAAGDAAEREADRVADQVLTRLQGGGASAPDHACAPDHDHAVSRSAAGPSGSAEVGREGGEISADLSTRIEGRRGGGAGLGSGVRERMETGFGESLGDVRIHADEESARLNRAVSARAFTVGKDVFFGAGEYRPDTPAGEQVLAHELAHTRQEGAAARRTVRRWDLGARRIDWSQAASVGVVSSGQYVYFLEDGTGDKVALKPERQPIGLADLAGKMHESLSGVESVKHRPLDDQDVADFIGLLGNETRLDRAQWAKVGLLKRDDKRDIAGIAEFLKVEQTAVREMSDFELGRAWHARKLADRDRMVAMSFASGDTAGKTVTKAGGDSYEKGESNRMRTLLTDYQHVQHLGLLTAVDLFLGNDDRVYSGNLGNWIYDPHSTAMTVLDHLNDHAANSFRKRTEAVPQLAKKELKATVAYTVESFEGSMRREGDPDFGSWLAADGGVRRKRLEEALERGLVDGRKLLVKTFTSTRYSGSKKARAVKKSIKQAGREATGIDDNQDRDDYYNVLKRRAQWLTKH
jgi:hypothetical protein